MKQDLFRDKNLQSQKDNELVSKLREYLDNSPGDNLVKFDNFSAGVGGTTRRTQNARNARWGNKLRQIFEAQPEFFEAQP